MDQDRCSVVEVSRTPFHTHGGKSSAQDKRKAVRSERQTHMKRTKQVPWEGLTGTI
jgi:hypothetical protein